MKYIITGIICAGLTFGFSSCNNTSTEKTSAFAEVVDSVSTKELPDNINAYEDLRQLALTVSYQRLGLALPSDRTVVYGVIMDWEIGGGIATTVAYQTGDASLYVSTGGGIVGGIGHANVRHAAKQFVTLAQGYLNKSIKTETSPLPMSNEVQFYLLTNKGIFVGQDQMKNMENNSSPWFKLFEMSNVLMKELRTTK